MAYYYNTVVLLATIRGNDINKACFSCTDKRGREFSYEGNLIRVDNITKMIHDIFECYVSHATTHCFFGKEMPLSLHIAFKIEDSLTIYRTVNLVIALSTIPIILLPVIIQAMANGYCRIPKEPHSLLTVMMGSSCGNPSPVFNC